MLSRRPLPDVQIQKQAWRWHAFQMRALCACADAAKGKGSPERFTCTLRKAESRPRLVSEQRREEYHEQSSLSGEYVTNAHRWHSMHLAAHC
mmetsp:Transcript_19977/g.49830  ORF Transcript_19977/g.49830 Transcript_19977/m.49830 type:complete len:92 (+) Transcript_19977:2-277(+)